MQIEQLVADHRAGVPPAVAIPLLTAILVLLAAIIGTVVLGVGQ